MVVFCPLTRADEKSVQCYSQNDRGTVQARHRVWTIGETSTTEGGSVS